MADVFNISWAGGRELQRKLNRLPETIQREIIPPIFTRSVDRVANEIARAFSGEIVEERTGVTSDAFASLRAKRITGKGASTIAIAAKLPSKAKLGIKDGSYYPAALEYGFSVGKTQVAAKAPIRKTVNRMQAGELSRVGRELGLAIERAAMRGLRGAG